MTFRKALVLTVIPLLFFLSSTSGCSFSPKGPQIPVLYRHGFTARAEGTDGDGQVLYRSSLRYENGCLTVVTQEPSRLTLTICGEEQRLFSADNAPVQIPASILTPWRGLAELMALTADEAYWQQPRAEAGVLCYTFARADGLQAEVQLDETGLSLLGASIRFRDCITVWSFTDFTYLPAPQE